MNNIDLRDLSAFAAVARHRNLRRAALAQRMSVSSLSQRLRTLEEQLGVRLLNRTTRSEAEELLLARIAPAFQEVSKAVGAVRGLGDIPSGPAAHQRAGTGRAARAGTHGDAFPQAFSSDRLGDHGRAVAIVAEGFDAGVRFEEHLAQEMIAVSL